MRKIGMLTGGGDCPGLNAVIRGVVEKCATDDIEVFGFIDGWRGAMAGEGKWLTLDDVEGLQTKGGTILGSSRTNVMAYEDGPDRVKAAMAKLGLEGLVAIGGDDTLGVGAKLMEQGFNIIGVPKTIDNDLNCTDFTFGFDTAANITMDSIDKLHTTADSHHRCIVVEIMGRHTGWIAFQGGVAGDAHITVIPEFPMSLDEICAIIEKRKARGKAYHIIAVAEGASISGMEIDESTAPRDAFGNIMLPKLAIGERLAEAVEKQTGIESRHVVLGHLQRGGPPSAFDRVLGLRMGIKAGEEVIKNAYGTMMGLAGTQIVTVSLSQAVSMRKEVDEQLYDCAKLLFR